MKNLVLLVAALVALAFFSCKKEDMSQTNVNIVLRTGLSGSATLKAATLSGTKGPDEDNRLIMTSSEVALETFLINIEEIEFDLEDEGDDHEGDLDDQEGTVEDEDDDDSSDEFEIKGPVVIDLLSDEAGNGFLVAVADLPNGIYDELEVELGKHTEDPDNEIYGHTIYIEGQINGQDIKMWYDEDFDIEIDFPDTGQNFSLTGEEVNLYIDFYIDKMLDNLSSFDFNGLKDGNGNGIIEIGPDDTDGNNGFTHHFIKSLRVSFELDDDDDDDDDDDEEEDDDK